MTATNDMFYMDNVPAPGGVRLTAYWFQQPSGAWNVRVHGSLQLYRWAGEEPAFEPGDHVAYANGLESFVNPDGQIARTATSATCGYHPGYVPPRHKAPTWK